MKKLGTNDSVLSFTTLWLKYLIFNYVLRRFFRIFLNSNNKYKKINWTYLNNKL